jgi:hypothetical protein
MLFSDQQPSTMTISNTPKQIALIVSLICCRIYSYSQDSLDRIIRIQQQVLLPGKAGNKDTAFKMIFLSVANNRDSFWIPQYGYLPSDGSITLITGLPFMSIYKKNKSTLRKRFILSDVFILEGGLSFDAPKRTDFSSLGREEKIIDSRNFEEKTRSVLNKYARIGVLRDEYHGEVTIITPFIPLALPSSSHYKGFAAFLLKYDLSKPLYEITLLAEESLYSDPEMRNAQSDEVKNAAANLLQNIINDFAK